MRKPQVGTPRAVPGSLSLRAIAPPVVTFLLGTVIAHAFSSDQKASGGSAQSQQECHPTPSAHGNVSSYSAAVQKLARLGEPDVGEPLEASEQRETVEPNAELAATQRKQASKELLTLVRRQAFMGEHMFPGQEPDLALSQALPYLQGMSDALSKAGGDFVQELAADVEGTLCSKDASAALKLAMLRLTEGNPDLGSARGFDCAIGDARSPSLKIAAVDAWRGTGLPRSESMVSLAASDPSMAARLEETTHEQPGSDVVDPDGNQ